MIWATVNAGDDRCTAQFFPSSSLYCPSTDTIGELQAEEAAAIVQPVSSSLPARKSPH